MTAYGKALQVVHRVVNGLAERSAFVRYAKSKVPYMSIIDQYVHGGRIPWSPGYSKFKNALLIQTLKDPEIMESFRSGAPLPNGFGARIDERVVECPWALAKLGRDDGRLLDAGSVLNTPYFLETPELTNRQIVIYSLLIDTLTLDPRISYVHGDFRDSIFREQAFDTIVCISTLEHVGMWPAPTPPYAESLSKPQPQKDHKAFRGVLESFCKLLRPGGRLLLTVPFGAYEDHDWLQIYDSNLIEEAKTAFGGRVVSETYYRHTALGWNVSTAQECANDRYFNIVRTPEFDSDFAAAARAVACLELARI